ncbi:hypothetical protein F5972_08415 [Microbispora cellulosiformans]|uniref:Uncharacterized protein n=1 Tax=Microbispora cellulosiformans TaxID=2614688 RepID=A0A5J5K570_9ACTN|nr:hypothetical protein [Microbispora cellulosiformans]KAA9379666.1 hypothetical protein F5972_08415 [Microbispora cellulosiformans]
MTATATATTAEELRAQAAAEDAKAQRSYEDCDTDGFVSQWAHGVVAQELRLQASIEEAGGKALFPALFDTAGRLVPAKLMSGQWGVYFALLDERGRITGTWFTPSKAQDAKRARANDARKGYYVGYVMAPAQAEIRGTSTVSCAAYAVRTDGGYSPEAEVVDNGQHDQYTWELGRWYAVQGGLI